MDKVIVDKNTLVVNSSKASLTIDANKVIAITTEVDDFDWRYSDSKPFQDQTKKVEYKVYLYYCNDGCSLNIDCSDEQEMKDIYSQLQAKVFGYFPQHQQPTV